MRILHSSFRWSTLFFVPTHHHNFLQSLRLLSTFLLLLTGFSLPILAQVDCVDPGGTATVVVNVVNPPPGVQVARDFTATLPLNAGHTIIANSCTATIGGVGAGTCTIAPDGQSLLWNGTILNGETLTLTYRVQVAATTPLNSVVTINNDLTPPGDLIFPATSNLVIGCQAAVVPTARVSDQKPGSVLVFPYYTSNLAGTNDTRISMTNVLSPRLPKAFQAFVHVFLVDGASCLQTDFFVCLTPGATFTFTAQSYDPEITGYVIGVAVDGTTGLPVQNNVLIGNAFVNTTDYFGNYGAESFAANSTNLFIDNGTTARLFFDNIGYDAVPKEFTVEIQSAVDVLTPFQRIVTAGLIGDLSSGALTGASQVTAGQIINENERAVSVSNVVTGGCQAFGVISNSLRVAGGLSNLIGAGMSGSVKFKVGGAVGLLLTPRGTKWGGIRTLHKTATVATSLTIPVFTPNCPAL
jgi:hypothetical protein